MEDLIYADHAATTPLRSEVAQAMDGCREQAFANPSSAHRWGRWARRRLNEAREEAAAALGTLAVRVFWTRGGTESANIAVLGRIRRVAGEGSRPVVATSDIEHPAVARAAEQAATEGAVHVGIGVHRGELDMDGLRSALAQRPALVSCMWVNNETGLCLPVGDVAAECARAGVPLHSDAVQAVGKIPVRLDETPLDMLTVAGHKIYGPRSAGVLVAPEAGFLHPLHYGGGQEHGLRPGTEDVAGAAGMAEALRLAKAELATESARIEALRTAVEARIRERVPGVRVREEQHVRAPHISSLAVPGADESTLLAALDMAGVAASSGAACSSGSSVRTAQGNDQTSGEATLRLSFGRLSRAEHVDRLSDAVRDATARARGLNSEEQP